MLIQTLIVLAGCHFVLQMRTHKQIVEKHVIYVEVSALFYWYLSRLAWQEPAGHFYPPKHSWQLRKYVLSAFKYFSICS